MSITSCNVQIYLPDGSKASVIKVLPDNTLREILYNIDFRPDYRYVLFIGCPGDKHGTPLVDENKTMKDINMWFDDMTYIAEITIYREDAEYNKALYEMYSSSSCNTKQKNETIAPLNK